MTVKNTSQMFVYASTNGESISLMPGEVGEVSPALYLILMDSHHKDNIEVTNMPLSISRPEVDGVYLYYEEV